MNSSLTRLPRHSLAGLAAFFALLVCPESSRAQYETATVQFSAGAYAAMETPGPFKIVITLSQELSDDVTVQLTTTNGTAVVNEDFLDATGIIIIPAGKTSVAVDVTILDDDSNENTETINLTLSDPVNAVLGIPSQAIIEISDDDQMPIVEFTQDPFVGFENKGTMTLTVSVTPVSGKDVSFYFTTMDISEGKALGMFDYEPKNGLFTIPAGTPSLDIEIALTSDEDIDDEYFGAVISLPAGATLGEKYEVKAIIKTDEYGPPPLVSFEVANFYVGELDGKATIYVTLSSPYGKEVSVTCATLSGGSATPSDDYTPNSETLTFAVGETVKEFTVDINVLPENDPIEPDETVNLGLSDLVSSVSGEFMVATLVIIDKTVPPTVSLGIDTNMDGKIDAVDDKIKQDKKAIIINVNNWAAKKEGLPFNQDNVINGAEGKKEMAVLLLRQIKNFPKGGTLTLKVSDNKKMRIFNEADVGVIGPAMDVGGPDTDSYQVSADTIVKGNLTFLIECCNHGNETVTLTLNDAGENKVSEDWVRVVLNVDRLPGFFENPICSAIRFYVGTAVDRKEADMDGIEGTIETAKAKLNYAPKTRTSSRTGPWISVGNLDDEKKQYWIQTGLDCIRKVGKEPEYRIYCEVVNGIDMTHNDPDCEKDGADPMKYDIQFKMIDGMSEDWPAKATYKIAVTDATKGDIKGVLDGKAWYTIKYDDWKTIKCKRYAATCEMFHSVDQCAGTNDKPCVISGVSVSVKGKAENAAFQKPGGFIVDFDMKGKDVAISEKHHQWEFSDQDAPTGFRFWDKVLEY